MKRNLLLLALAIPLAAQAVQDCTLNGEHVNPANGNTTKGKTGLMRCFDRDSKQLEREQELQDGKFMGVVRHYRDGKLQKDYSVNEKGNQHGRAREFGPNGKVVRESVQENGQTVGVARSFFEDGSPRRTAFHAGDGREMASAEFTEKGQLSSLRCGERPLLAPAVDDGKLCGFGGGPSSVELFSSRGVLRSKLSYVSGKLVRSEGFFDNGKTSELNEITASAQTNVRFTPEGLKRSEAVYALTERGRRMEVQRDYSERGTLAREQKWNASSEQTSDDTWYLNGQPKSKTTYARDGANVTVEQKQFHDNGKLASEGRYLRTGRSREIALGTHRFYAENGALAGESIHDDKGRLSRQKAWDESGKLVRDEEVFEDGSRKAYSR